MKDLDEYFLMVVFTLLNRDLPILCWIWTEKQGLLVSQTLTACVVGCFQKGIEPTEHLPTPKQFLINAEIIALREVSQKQKLLLTICKFYVSFEQRNMAEKQVEAHNAG